MQLSAARIAKPFCRLEEAAHFLDLTFNEAQHLWEARALPRAVDQGGTTWMPGGRRLVRCIALAGLLDEEGAELFDKWQRDELRIAARASSADRRDTPVRLLDNDPLPPHGTTARFARECRCPDCRGAQAAYLKRYKERRK
jgi:hypothetical protein